MPHSEVTLGMGRTYAIVLHDRVVDIVGPIKGPGKSAYDHDRIVDITWRPDIKVGDTWPWLNLKDLAEKQAKEKAESEPPNTT
jgi:hypothetical protein